MDEKLDLGFEDFMEFVAHAEGDAQRFTAADNLNEERRANGMFQFEEEALPAVIKVIGVGGGGSNAVSTMYQSDIKGVQFIIANTDMQALELARAPIKLQIGSKLTCGRGAGANPEIGRNAALEDSEKIKAALTGTEMVFITAGMGGGTGTGAAPIVAQIAKEAGTLAIGVVTKPFTFEGNRRSHTAEDGIARLKEQVNTLIVIPNDRLLQLSDKRATLQDSFRTADDVLRQGVQGISELITVPGLINVDFADVRAVMQEGGAALMAVGRASGEDRARKAAEQAIFSQLLDITIDGARGVIFNVTAGNNLSLLEVSEAAAIIKETAHPDVNLIFGAVIDPSLTDEMRITVIATGFEKPAVTRKLDRILARPAPFKASQMTLPSSSAQAAVPLTPRRINAAIPMEVSVRPGVPVYSGMTEGEDDHELPAFLRLKNNRS
jgi:cell division protein FtsZ